MKRTPATAEVRNAVGLEVRFAGDSPLERAGFEPSVPRSRLKEL
jgi:hypothetical protein